VSHYVSIFEPIPWLAFGTTMLQAFVVYWFIIVGIKLIGIHVFGQAGPQYLLLLLLIVSGMSNGMIHQQAGFWGSIAAGLSLLITVALVQKISPLKAWIHEKPIQLLDQNGHIDKHALKRTLVQSEDLDKMAHAYGYPSYSVFKQIQLENDGRITGVLKPEHQKTIKKGCNTLNTLI
jgi:uncharacterized membrane protein YcaP (DUF421 family)